MTEQSQSEARQTILTALTESPSITDAWAGPRSNEISFTAVNALGEEIQGTVTVRVKVSQ